MQQYLTSNADDPKCMSPDCNRRFDREVLTTMLPKTFINGNLKEHRERCLFEQEIAMLPATQVHVVQEQRRRANISRMKTLREEYVRLREEMRLNQRAIYALHQEINANSAVSAMSTSAFVQRCSRENCRGWLTAAWKCTVCEEYTCSECHAPKRGREDPDHVCDDGDKLTVKLLRRDSRKCPKCAIYITKIDGCDQMFCTHCHQAFSWRTGQMINHNIHNPHYFEVMQRQGIQPGRALGDIPCGGLPTIREIHVALNDRDVQEIRYILQLLRLITHIQYVERPRYPVQRNATENVDLRVRYCLGELTDAAFRTQLQRREKNVQKKRDFGEVLEMLEHTLGDELRRVVIDKDVSEFRARATALLVYGNTACQKIGKRYECRPFAIDVDRMQVTGRH